jgi:heterodisulfide reductase subunit A
VNIAAAVDVAAVSDFASHLPGVIISRDYTYMCSDPGQVMIKDDIAGLDLNRVVVASCSPLMHEPTFRACIADAGLNPYCLEMANIREQCAWVHSPGENTTQKAMRLVASAVAKARRLEPLQLRHVEITPAALVIGAGVAGLQSALDFAEAGFKTTLVENSSSLGGHLAQWQCTFPTLQPAAEILEPLIESVVNHPKINVLTEASLEGIQGYIGNFQAQVRQNDQLHEVPAGVIVVATGFEAYDARRKPELGYGMYPQVITTLDFERLVEGEGWSLNKPRKVVFIQCVGSRDPAAGNSYCSRVCCMVTAKQAKIVRERLPHAEITVFYMDVRAFGKGFEEFYDQVRESGVVYRRGNPSEIIKRGERVVVRVEDTLLGEAVEVEADLVVLAVGMVPRASTPALSGLLKLARSADGFFMEAHPKLRPVETAMAGVFLAGCCQGPKDVTETIVQARAAAAAGMIPLLRRHVQVDAATAFIDEDMCSGCGQCARACSFEALSLKTLIPGPASLSGEFNLLPGRTTLQLMRVNPVLCQGCGACAAACPSGAINLHQFTFDQVLAQIDELMEMPLLHEVPV